ncbi:MAG: crotonase/enoyl-CoA hydratase family protein [Polyangiaceae bacterium]|nr:crotonase/enoyl-CoA hydratase family protein [Polyangiaceae bacterium]
MTDASVSVEIRDHIALIKLDDGRANALGIATLEALEAALDRAEREARTVVLTGRPGRFCAGFDLNVMMSGPENARALVMRGADTFLRLYAHPQPLVIACSGHAVAGGALVVLTGDLRIGASGAFKIGLNELAIGMPLPILAHELAHDRLSRRYFTEATLGAGQFTPERAVEAGYLDRLVEPERLLDTALAEAQRLTALSGKMYAISKRSIRRRTIQYIKDTLAQNMEEFSVG